MTIPRARGFDQSLLFARDGYDFITKQCEALGTDIFQARLMLGNVICMRGSPAAELFYASGKFTRVGAMPITILMLLQDFGSVQLLHGHAHRHRKAMFLDIGRPQAAASLAGSFIQEWERALPRWKRAGRIVLFPEMEGNAHPLRLCLGGFSPFGGGSSPAHARIFRDACRDWQLRSPHLTRTLASPADRALGPGRHRASADC
jgi:hypothetical protein